MGVTDGRELWSTAIDDLTVADREQLDFLNNAPMPAALVNQLITEFHAQLAERLAEHMYANVEELPPTGPCPTFLAYAHHASAAVGEQLRSRLPSGRRRRARALVDGNRDVAFTVGLAALAFVVGEPLDPEPDPGPAHDLWLGFARYRDAAVSTDLAAKSRLILEGNERILAFEQRLLEAHLGVALRITTRRVTSPMSRFSTSQREWRTRDPGRLRLRLENVVARFATLAVSYDLPGQTRKLRAFRRPRRVSTIEHECAIADTKPARVRCWMCFESRMNWIVHVMHLAHEDRWFDVDLEDRRFRLRRAKPWNGFEHERARYRQRYLSDSGAADALGLTNGEFSTALQHPALDTPPRLASAESTGLASTADWSAASGFYTQNRAEVFAALMARSLPATFASPLGAPVLDPQAVDGLHRSSAIVAKRLAGDSFPRVARTVQFLDEVFSGGQQRLAALSHARGRHSEVRDELIDWELGTPVNQEHMLATVTTFVCPVRQVFDEFGFGEKGHVDDETWDAWARVWSEIGVWLGLDIGYLRRELRPTSHVIEYEDLLDIAARLDVAKRARNLAGVRLMDNLIGDLSDGYPRAARRLPSIALWSLGDEELLRMLLVQPSIRGSMGRRVALWAAHSNPVVRTGWRWIRRWSAKWILDEIAEAGDPQTFDSLRFFPPDCSVTDLGSYRPVVFTPVVGANVNEAV